MGDETTLQPTGKIDLPLPPEATGLQVHLGAMVDRNGSYEGGDVAAAIFYGRPMDCKGNDCIYIQKCPFSNNEALPDPPEKQTCPVEIDFLMRVYMGYMKQADPTGLNDSVRSMVSELCSIDLNIQRAAWAQAINDGRVVEWSHVGFDKETQVAIEQKKGSAELGQYMKLIDKKLKYMDQLGITPKARAKMKASLFEDPSTVAGKLTQAFNKLMKAEQEKIEKETNMYHGLERDNDDGHVDAEAIVIDAEFTDGSDTERTPGASCQVGDDETTVSEEPKDVRPAEQEHAGESDGRDVPTGDGRPDEDREDGEQQRSDEEDDEPGECYVSGCPEF